MENELKTNLSTCPNCKHITDDVDFVAYSHGAGELDSEGNMLADCIDDRIITITCSYCGNVLDNNIVKGWSWKS